MLIYSYALPVLMEYRLIAASAILALTYGLIFARGLVRRINVPIWLVMLIGAVLMVMLGVVSPSEAYASIDLQVLVFLFSLFTISSALEVSGFLTYVAHRLVSSSRKMSKLIGRVLVYSAVMSMFISNDGLSAAFTPVLIESGRRARGVDVKPLLYALAFGVTIGSVAIPIGNPQNLLIALESGLPRPFITFIIYLMVPTAVNIAVTYLILLALFRNVAGDDIEVSAAEPRLKDPFLAKFALASLALMVIVLILSDILDINLNTPMVALLFAAAIYAVTPRRDEVLFNVDWQTLVFFAGLFIVSAGTVYSGILPILARYLPSPTSLVGIFASGLLVSQVISNVPMVAIYIPLMRSLGVGPGDVKDWLALAASSTIAGNLTIIGAASNIIISQASERRGGPGFSYLEFVKYGLPTTFANALVYFAFLKIM